MSVQIDLPPEWESQLREEARRRGVDVGLLAGEILARQLITDELAALKNRVPPKSLDDLKPRVPVPAGVSWIHSIAGQWPGDESDEEFERAVAEMS
jgi:hypothetical protein